MEIEKLRSKGVAMYCRLHLCLNMRALRSFLRILKHVCACNFEFESSAGSSNMSAEPNRKVPYSIDMCWRIICDVTGTDSPFNLLISI